MTITSLLEPFPPPSEGEGIETPAETIANRGPTRPIRSPRQEASSMDAPVEIIEFSDYL